jgi:hypothetical protein
MVSTSKCNPRQKEQDGSYPFLIAHVAAVDHAFLQQISHPAIDRLMDHSVSIFLFLAFSLF